MLLAHAMYGIHVHPPNWIGDFSAKSHNAKKRTKKKLKESHTAHVDIEKSMLNCD